MNDPIHLSMTPNEAHVLENCLRTQRGTLECFKACAFSESPHFQPYLEVDEIIVGLLQRLKLERGE